MGDFSLPVLRSSCVYAQCMTDFYFTTGQIAEALKTSTQTIRRLCMSGQIKAERSAGGHFRIASAELERLKALEVLPPAARATIPENCTRQAKKNPHELLAPPSAEVIESAETAFVNDRHLAADTSRLQRMRVHKEALELADYFEDRESRRLAREIEEDRREFDATEKRRQQREAQSAAQERRAFEAEWLAYAINERPWDAPPDYAVIVQGEVLSALAAVSLAQDHWTVRSMVDAAIARALQPWRDGQARLEAKHRAVESTLSDLPFWMKHDDAWGPRARQIAEESVDSARDGATASQMAIAAKLALNPLRAEYEHAERIKQAMGFVYLSNGTKEDNQNARDAVRDALAGLAVDASDREIERTKQAALEPIRQRIAARIQQEREERERQEAKLRLVEVGLREVSEYASKMLKQFEYEDSESSFSIELRVRNKVHKTLSEELGGDESESEVRRLARELMRKLEGCD